MKSNSFSSSFGDEPSNQVISIFKNLTVSIQHLKQNVASFCQNVSHLSNESNYSENGLTHRSNSVILSNIQNKLNPSLINNQIKEIETNIQQMESRLHIEIIDPSEKRQFQVKVKNLVDELNDIKEEMKQHSKKHDRYLREREILLDGELKENDPLQKRQHLLNQNLSLDRSIHVMEQIKDTGRNVLGMLSEQSESLRNVREKLFEMGSSLGISQSVLRSIDRRMKMDTLIVCCGMFFIIILLILIWYYLM